MSGSSLLSTSRSKGSRVRNLILRLTLLGSLCAATETRAQEREPAADAGAPGAAELGGPSLPAPLTTDAAQPLGASDAGIPQAPSDGAGSAVVEPALGSSDLSAEAEAPLLTLRGRVVSASDGSPVPEVL